MTEVDPREAADYWRGRTEDWIHRASAAETEVERLRALTVDDPTSIYHEHEQQRLEIIRLREALTLIRDTDPVDAILDPDRATRVAREALR